MVEIDLINKHGKKYNSLINWKLGGTFQRILSYQNEHEFEHICPLCQQICHDTTQIHLTSSCVKTHISCLIYKKDIKLISRSMYKEYHRLTDANKFIWSMTSGCRSKETSQNNKFKIVEGESIREGIDKNDPQDIAYAFDQFDAILQKINKHSIIIYTDGSKINEKVGAGSCSYI